MSGSNDCLVRRRFHGAYSLVMANQTWRRLDNAAQIFPSVTTDRRTNLFRLSVTLREAVQPAILQRALHAVVPRFPSFRVHLKPGLFWYSLVDEPEMPRLYPESASPCQGFRRNVRSPLLFRVRWFGRRFAVEFHHALTDGSGGLVFVRALTAEYLTLAGIEDDDSDDLRRVAHEPEPAEDHDDFHDLYDARFPRHPALDQAFQPPWPLVPRGSYFVTTGRLSVKGALAKAKERGATLTEYLAACLLAAFQDAFLALPAQERERLAKPVRLVIPVNLRPIFRSKTLRNFFVVIPVEIDLRLGIYDFDEIVRKVHHQLQAEMDPKLLKKQVNRNLRGELNVVARVIPLPLKNGILRGIFRSYERRQTASLSNLGRVDWPSRWGAAIQSVDFTPPPSPRCLINVGVASCGDQLSITLGSLSSEPEVERVFFRRLRQAGLAVAIESNRTEET